MISKKHNDLTLSLDPRGGDGGITDNTAVAGGYAGKSKHVNLNSTELEMSLNLIPMHFET